ncbi:sigma-70 family RNA polymerase sigma factor [Echinicola jeungdonensis]|uniref:RNA polymerase sigma factor n=1 Tax=Echinicola jeungdonensis TaxID=709343 RepID=A0ABV5J374_9BACT|nr:sigma-70 family RNA polymerase sigma factor [Echinicola jeungdonensis]MDN3670703.1 sigma-70 family RNA polymerase sigma factor [Echinicola jeungdonensis]
MPKSAPKHIVEMKNIISESTSEIDFSNDRGIWEAFKSGNESAFIFIYESHFETLFDYGCKFTKDTGIVKDAIQDLFIELRNKRDSLGATNNIKFYLFKSLKRKIIRESGRWFRKWERLAGNYYFEFSFSPEQILIDRQLDQEKHASLNTALKELTDRQKEIIYYFYFEGLSYEQIKEIMCFTSTKATRNLLYRAIDFLKDAVQ